MGRTSVRRLVLGLLLVGGLAPAVACSRSTEDAENRGLVVEPEVAVPDAPKELRETAAERKARSEAELEQAEQKRFDEIEERARSTAPPPEP